MTIGGYEADNADELLGHARPEPCGILR
jgi:hypothetical protein